MYEKAWAIGLPCYNTGKLKLIEVNALDHLEYVIRKSCFSASSVGPGGGIRLYVVDMVVICVLLARLR